MNMPFSTESYQVSLRCSEAVNPFAQHLLQKCTVHFSEIAKF
jgi:hypothetical protein